MRLVERMLLELNAGYNGDAWHGTPLRRLIEDVDEKQSRTRPVANARSIAELLGHVNAWMDIVQRRLTGEDVQVTHELDFPDVSNLPWGEALARLDASNSRLLDTVARMRDDDFDKKVPGKNYTVDFMLHGLVNHNAYHAGQIAILKK